MPGDEQKARWQARDLPCIDQLAAWWHAARAIGQLASVMRDQGMIDEADHCAYRAQVCRRRVLWRPHKFGGYLFSLLLAVLAVLAGYGVRLGRILVAYALNVGVFAAAFLA